MLAGVFKKNFNVIVIKKNHGSCFITDFCHVICFELVN